MQSILRSSSPFRIDMISRKFDELIDKKVKNRKERELLENLLRLGVLDSKNKLSQVPKIPQRAIDILNRYNLKSPSTSSRLSSDCS